MLNLASRRVQDLVQIQARLMNDDHELTTESPQEITLSHPQSNLMDSPASPEPELNDSIHEMTGIQLETSLLDSPASPEPELNDSIHETTLSYLQSSLLDSHASPEPELNDSIHEMTRGQLETSMLDSPASPEHELNSMDCPASPDPHEAIISCCPNYDETSSSCWSRAPLRGIACSSRHEDSNSSWATFDAPASPSASSSAYDEDSNCSFSSSVNAPFSLSASSSRYDEVSLNSSWASQSISLASGYSTLGSDRGYHTNATLNSDHDDTSWSCWSTFNAVEEEDITAASDPGYLTDSCNRLPSMHYPPSPDHHQATDDSMSFLDQESIVSDTSQEDMYADDE